MRAVPFLTVILRSESMWFSLHALGVGPFLTSPQSVMARDVFLDSKVVLKANFSSYSITRFRSYVQKPVII